MLNKLQNIQMDCDEISFTIMGKKYKELVPIEILRHKCFHIANLLAKISRICEQSEHEIEVDLMPIIDEVVPDLLIYSLQLANAFQVNLDEKYKERIEFVIEKGKQYHSPKVFDLNLDKKLKKKIVNVLGS